MRLLNIFTVPVALVGRIKSMSVVRWLTSRYLYNLAESLRELSPEGKDRHVWDLEEKVRELERQDALLENRMSVL
jgi:hypothetical protein